MPTLKRILCQYAEEDAARPLAPVSAGFALNRYKTYVSRTWASRPGRTPRMFGATMPYGKLRRHEATPILRRIWEAHGNWLSGLPRASCDDSMKEEEVRILDSVLRRRGPAPAYRTIDGGHPAPYPDMTDEQLYNYELAFDVPRKTFDRPPPTARGGRYRGRIEPELAPVTNLYATQPQPSHAYGNDFNTAAARTAAPEWQQPPKTESMPYANTVTSAQEEEEPEQDEEMHTETATDAEDDNEATAWFAEANAWRAERNPRTSGDPRPLDFSKPVRTITTRQPVEIITTRARHPVYRVHGYIGEDEVVTVFTLDGQLSEHGPRFLENVPEQQELYLNIYPGLDGKERYRITQHESRAQADAAAAPGRISCIKADFTL